MLKQSWADFRPEAAWRWPSPTAITGWSCGSARGGTWWGVSQTTRGLIEAALTERGRRSGAKSGVPYGGLRQGSGQMEPGGWWRWRRRLGSAGYLCEQRGEVEEPSAAFVRQNRGRNGGVGAQVQCAKERRGAVSTGHDGGGCRLGEWGTSCCGPIREEVGGTWAGVGVVGWSFWASPR
jgi:hypothetical protein